MGMKYVKEIGNYNFCTFFNFKNQCANKFPPYVCSCNDFGICATVTTGAIIGYCAGALTGLACLVGIYFGWKKREKYVLF